MPHQIELGPRTFASKTTAKAYVRSEILHSYELGEPITNPEHVGVLEAIVLRKPNAGEKIGDGIAHFYVESTRRFRSYAREEHRTLVIHHANGDEPDVDFSYEKAIDGEGQVDFVDDALRQEAQGLRDGFKFSSFDSGGTVYDYRGEPMTHHSEAEVRYGVPSWAKLVYDFVQSEGGWDAIQTTSGDGDAQIGRRLVDEDVRQRWLEHWHSNADPYLLKK